MKPAAPYLSVVATARNDNHGGDLLLRMQTFINGVAEQCARHRLDAEVIVVEWNPPPDRPRLAEALTWPENPWCAMRIIEVPPEVHARLEHSDRLPLFQMIAKNVGIRRARGEFVLATNVDILFPDELIEELSRRELQYDRYYVVDRHDVAITPDPSLPIDETLQLCSRNVVRICTRMGTRDLVTGRYYPIHAERELPLWVRRAIYFSRAAKRRIVLSWNYCVDAVGLRGKGAGESLVPSASPSSSASQEPSLEATTRRSVRRVLADEARRAYIAWRAEAVRISLHTNACGDFTLLSRSGWETTRAYPELEMFSMHIDGLFLVEAHYGGFAEAELPHRIFHIEHAQGFKPAPAAVKSLDERLRRAAIPQVTTDQFSRWLTEMSITGRPIAFNGDDWGFAAESLPEVTPVLQRTRAHA